MIFTENPAILHVSGSCGINGNSISIKVSSALYFVLCSLKSGVFALFCSGLFCFALGSSVLLWALLFCSGLFCFALGSSVLLSLFRVTMCSSGCSFPLPFTLGTSVCSFPLPFSLGTSVCSGLFCLFSLFSFALRNTPELCLDYIPR